MGFTSRPPLASRIRASFDGGKRARSSQDNLDSLNPLGSHPTSGMFSPDPDSLRNAIDAAINSETFQTAIAANLAKLIKPNIKSALDTIQPLVESVYAHEMLLRKTNRSVEDILDRVGDGAIGSRRASRVESEVEFPTKRASKVQLDEDGGEATPTAEDFKEIHTEEKPKEETPKEETPKEEIPKEETPKEETPKKETPKEEVPKEIVQDKAIVATSPAHNLEEFKQLLDENNAKTATALSNISSSVSSSNTAIMSLAQGFDGINSLLHPTHQHVEKLASSSEQSATVMAVIQGQLDQLKDDIGSIMSELSAIKGGISAASNKESFNRLSTEINGVLTAVEEHTNTLSEIKNSSPHPEIVSALQQSNVHHTSHAAALSELKERSLAAPAEAKVGPDHTAALEDLKADLASMKANIEAGLTSNNDNLTNLGSKIDTHHEKHAEALEGMRSLNVPSAPIESTGNPELEAHIAKISSSLDAHTTALDNIKASHIAHATALEGLPAALKGTGSEPADYTEHFEALDAKIGGIKSSLDAHAAALDEIKAAHTSHKSALESQAASLDEIKVAGANHSVSLESQTGILDDLKAASATHSAALETHGTTLQEVRDLNSTSAPVPSASVDTSALEDHITALASTLNAHTGTLAELKDSHVSHASALENHTATLEDIKAATTSHTSTLEKLKSTPAPANDIPVPVVDTEKLDSIHSQIGNITSTLSTHTATLDQIIAGSGAHKAALDDIVGLQDGHTAALNEITAKNVAHAEALDGIKEFHQSHATALDEIKATNATHTASLDELKATNATHKTSLDELKNLSTSHATALESSRSLPEASPHSDPALTAQIAAISTTLDQHTSHLENLKSNLPTSTAIVPTSDEPSSGLLSTIIETLESHTTLLTEIKDDVAAEILTSLHDMGQVSASHTNLLTEIRESDVSDEILTLLHGTNEKLDTVAVGVQKVNDWEVEEGLGLIGEKLSDIDSKLEDHYDTLGAVKDTTAASHEFHLKHHATLGEIKEKAAEGAPVIGADGLHEKILDIATKLDEHHAKLAALHDDHAMSLDELKTRPVELAEPPAITIDVSSLEERLGLIQNTFDSHHSAIKDTFDNHHSALSNLHEAHASSLEELKGSAVLGQGIDTTVIEEKLGSIQSTLDDHHAILATIKNETSASLESHADHTTALNEIQQASLSSVDSHASHATALAGIKEIAEANHKATSNHQATLAEIKDAQNAHSAALAGIKTPMAEKKEPGSPDFAAMEIHLTAIISTLLEAQNSTLADIKASSSNKDILSSLNSLKTIVEGSKADIDEHSSLVKDLHTSTQDYHNNTKEKHEAILSGIAGLAAGGAAGSALSSTTDSKQVLEKLEAIHDLTSKTSNKITKVNEDITSMKSQLDINHTTLITSVTTLSDELKAEMDATGTSISDHLSILSADIKNTNGVHFSGKGIEQLKSHTENGTHFSDRGLSQLQAHLAPLTPVSTTPTDGVHLSSTGLAQLREHFTPDEPLNEGAWFGSKQRGMGLKSEGAGSESGSVILDPIHEEEEEDSPREKEFTHDDKETETKAPYVRDQVDVFKYLDDNATPDEGELSGPHEDKAAGGAKEKGEAAEGRAAVPVVEHDEGESTKAAIPSETKEKSHVVDKSEKPHAHRSHKVAKTEDSEDDDSEEDDSEEESSDEEDSDDEEEPENISKPAPKPAATEEKKTEKEEE